MSVQEAEAALYSSLPANVTSMFTRPAFFSVTLPSASTSATSVLLEEYVTARLFGFRKPRSLTVVFGFARSIIIIVSSNEMPASFFSFLITLMTYEA